MGRTCGEPNEILKNTHPKNITALVREQGSDGSSSSAVLTSALVSAGSVVFLMLVAVVVMAVARRRERMRQANSE